MILIALTLLAATAQARDPGTVRTAPARDPSLIRPGPRPTLTPRPRPGLPTLEANPLPRTGIFSGQPIPSPDGSSTMRLQRTVTSPREGFYLIVSSPPSECRVANFTTSKRQSFIIEWHPRKDATVLIRRDRRVTVDGDTKQFVLERTICGGAYVEEAPWPNID